MLCFYEGAWEQAVRYLEESSTISVGSGNLWQLRQAQALLAEKDLRERGPGPALTRLQPLVPEVREAADFAYHPSLVWMHLLALTHLELGRVADAEALVGEALRQAMQHRWPTDRVDALRIHGMVLARQGRWDEMGRVLEEAATLAHPMPYPYGEARVLYEHGRLLAQQGDLLKARDRLQEALAIFERLGARPHVEWTRRALGGCQ
jgi:tetratricopeptide (TPR) repeat protein